MNRRIRENYEAFMTPAGTLLSKLRLSPNVISVVSLGFAGVACVAFSVQRLGLGLGFVLISVFVDMLDGSVARASGKASYLGTIVDHTTDRYSEFLYIFGLCYGGYAPFWLGFLCYFSMLMPSYVRAKVDGSPTTLSCRGVGIAERKEKLGILVLCIVLSFFVDGAIAYGLIVVAAISQISAVQRIYHALQAGRSNESQELD